MKQLRIYKTLLLLFVFLIGGILVGAQDNLLTDPGFEGSFLTLSGDPPRSVATGWTPWHIPRTSDQPTFQNAQPAYEPTAPDTSRIRSGNNAQSYFSFFETHDGGIYQQVNGLTSGTELRFSIYAHVWSSTFNDVNVSEDPGDVTVQVGIDPTGGTDGTSSDIVWSTPALFYDVYRQYSVIATAEASTVTVFVRSRVGAPVQNSYVYLDDAELAATTPDPVQPVETDEPTEVPAQSEEPTDEPTEDAGIGESTPTPEGSTDTPIPPTDVPTTEPPTDTPVPPTDVPTNTPTSEPPTPTQETVVQVPTATEITSTGGNTDGTDKPTSESEVFPGTVVHTVRGGDTVGRLAILYNSSTESIINANGLNESALIFIGQGLLIPVRIPNPATETPTATPVVIVVTATPGEVPPVDNVADGTYLVLPGDTLSAIARRFNTTVGALVSLNGIVNPNRVLVGQRLLVPTAGATPVPTAPANEPTPVPTVEPQPITYVVQPGDNLYRISLRFNVSLLALAEENNITNYNFVFVGQRLTIPE